jgi:hypothetical protein
MEVKNIYNDYLKPVWSYLNGEAKKIASSLYAKAKEEYKEALDYYYSSVEYYKAHDGYASYPERPNYEVYYKKANSYIAMKKAIEKFLLACKEYNSKYNLPVDIGIVALSALDCIKNFDKAFNALRYSKYYFSLKHYMNALVYCDEGESVLRTIGSVPYSLCGSEVFTATIDIDDLILVRVED